MQDPNGQYFHSEPLKQILTLLYTEVFPRTVGTPIYPTFVTTLTQLGLLFPADRDTIARLTNSPIQQRYGMPAKAVDPSQFTQVTPLMLERDADCPSCPPKEVYLTATPQPSTKAKTVKLPPELLEPVLPAPPYKKPQEEMTFRDGETVQEVLEAHGLDALPLDEVRDRLCVTITTVLKRSADKSLPVEELAAIILDAKGVEAPAEDKVSKLRGRPSNKNKA